ncbi:RHS repeat domain-containing protein [Flavobacteriaceae bacterium 3-367]
MRTRTMKLLFFLGLGFAAFGQQPTQDDFYQSEVNKLVNIPVSPEAAAYAQYGNTPVNLYSGIPEISIPLHTLQGRELSLPVSLTYDASGVKVEAMASWAGLNWNLNVGGRITRVVNGLPDDYFGGGSYSTINSTGVATQINQYLNNNTRFPDQTAAEAYFNFLKDINLNYADAEPDYYVLSLPGINETIVMDITDNNKPKVLNNPRIKVDKDTLNQNGAGSLYPIQKWTITHEDGTVYHFDAKENTKVVGNDLTGSGAVTYEYTSSWLLTRIESSNKRDDFVLSYTNSAYWQQDQLASSSVTAVTQLLPQQTNYPTPNQTFNGTAQYWISQQFLSSISNNTKTLATVTLGNRYDVNSTLTASRLQQLTFTDFSGQAIRHVLFDNDDYFNLDGQLPSQRDRKDIRLKLNGLQIKGEDNTTYQTYSFEYDRPDELPSRTSKDQDYYGYHNGANNTVLYPGYVTQDGKTLTGADRAPDGDKAKIGLLTKITYPTKGYTEFEYGEHDVHQSSSTQSTQSFLAMNVHSGTVADSSLYYNDAGVACDDAFEGGPLPKVQLVTFTIPEGNDFYTIAYAGDTAHGAAYIQHYSSGCVTKPNGTVYCPPNPYENYCDFYGVGGITWSASTQPRTSLQSLEPGDYVALLILGPQNGGTFGSLTLNITKEVSTTTAANVAVGGIRIAKVTDYASSGLVARTKSYTYRDDANESTGKINFAPSLVRIQSLEDANGNEQAQILRTAAFPRGDAPHIIYTSVKESVLDENGLSEGYTVYDFYDGFKGAIPKSSPPYENNFRPSLSVGSPRTTQLFNKDNQLVSKTGVTYFEGPEPTVGTPALTWGMVVTTDQTQSDQIIMLKAGTNPITQVADVTYVSVLKSNCTTTPCVLQNYVTNPTAYGYLAALDGVSILNMRACAASGTYGGVSDVTRTMRYGDLATAPKEMVTQETTTYDPTVDYLPRSVRNTDSKGEVYETSYHYPKDNNVVGAPDLVTKNNLVEVVHQQTVKDPDGASPDTLSVRSVEYQFVATGVVLPKKIKTAKESLQNLEERVALEYYADGTLREAKPTDGATTFYIWGYKDMYPVAKIENVTRAQVEAIAGIGPDFKATSGALTTAEENALRTGLPDAMITTYTYDPYVGVTSVTDPRGYKTTYEYDDMQRLKQVKDKDGKIITDHDYKYATEAQN